METTLREALDQLGGVGHVFIDVPEPWERDLDRQVRLTFATATAEGGDQAGRLFVSCSGYAVLRIDWLDERGRVANRRPAYVVVDDLSQRSWRYRADQLREQGKGANEIVAELGRCPSERLRLVQSG